MCIWIWYIRLFVKITWNVKMLEAQCKMRFKCCRSLHLKERTAWYWLLIIKKNQLLYFSNNASALFCMYAHEKYFAQHFSLVINKFQDFQMHPIFITQIVDARKYVINKILNSFIYIQIYFLLNPHTIKIFKSFLNINS